MKKRVAIAVVDVEKRDGNTSEGESERGGSGGDTLVAD